MIGRIGSRVQPLPLTISEADFQSTVTETMEWLGWHWCHFFPLMNQRGKWQTPVMGHPGCPDIIASRDGDVLLIELKRAVGAKVSHEQRGWLRALGAHGRLWTPHQWNSGEILLTLRNGPTEPSVPDPRSRAESRRRPASGTAR